MAVVVIVVASVLTVNHRVQRALTAAAAKTDAARLEQAAAGGIHAAIALLLRDKETSEVDHLQEAWADPETVRSLGAAGLPADMRLTARITDLGALVQVNALVVFPAGHAVDARQQALWERLLDLPGLHEPRGEPGRLRPWSPVDSRTGSTGVTATPSPA